MDVFDTGNEGGGLFFYVCVCVYARILNKFYM